MAVGVFERWVCTALCLCVVCVLWGASPVLAAEGGCPNEAVREEQGPAALALPDCRGYEMVSPPGSIPNQTEHYVSAPDGERIGYESWSPPPGSGSESRLVLAERGPGGWSARLVTPPQGGEHTEGSACSPAVYYSVDLENLVLLDGQRGDEQSSVPVCEGDDPPLVSGEPRGVENLFLGSVGGSSYELLDRLPEGSAVAENAELRDTTPDLSDVLFEEDAPLTSEAPAGENLYEWAGGVVRLVTVLPNGTAVNGKLAGLFEGYDSSFTHAVSDDGERVFFYAGGNLYVRLNATMPQSRTGGCGEPERACTVQVDASEAGSGLIGGGGVFVDADEEGSRVVFADSRVLTSGAPSSESKPVLYEYDVETGVLADVTTPASGPAGVLGYSGSSEDGSYLYFVATSVLSGRQTNSQGARAVNGEPNLYLRHGGTTTFIATLEKEPTEEETSKSVAWIDSDDWTPVNVARSIFTGVSPDGQYFVFSSVVPLTGHGNRAAEPYECETEQGSCSELFLYDAGDNQLSCVSCGPEGEQPTGPTTALQPRSVTGNHSTKSGEAEGPYYWPRSVLDDGRIFFDTATPLVPQATNGESNVYEYEEGRVYLISSGSAVGASTFMDASASGEDVFFGTSQSLVRTDTDGGLSLYDARVAGGVPQSVESSGEPPACTSVEGCRPPLSEPPVQPFVGSVALAGQGNVTSSVPVKKPTSEAKDEKAVCRKGSTRRRGKCVKRRVKAKKRKKGRAKGAGGRDGRR